MALGAQRSNVPVMVLRRAFLLLLLGLSVGIALAFSTSRLIRSFLYGVGERDALTTVAVSLLLCLCEILAHIFQPAAPRQ